MRRAEKAKHFLDQIAIVHEYICGKGESCNPIKVAIIDTGVHLDASVRNLYGAKLKECRSWLYSKVDFEGRVELEGADQDGHGTHCTSAFLKCAPEDCELYVAQVFASSKEKIPDGPPSDNIRVARVCLASTIVTS